MKNSIAGSLLLATCLVAAPSSAAIPVVDGCAETAYLDRTSAAADRQFNWDYSFAGDPERCIRIQVGQSVRWSGSFASHPLDPDQGTTPNPIAAPVDGTVTFTQPGVFGYRCNFHFEMRGAVWVVPGATPVKAPALGAQWAWLSMAVALGAAGLSAIGIFRQT